MESFLSSPHKYFLNKFSNDVQQIVNELCKSKCIAPFKVNIVKAKNTKGDYFITLQSAGSLKKNTDVIVKELKKILYISDADIDSNFNLIITLNRNIVFKTVLEEISIDSKKYGFSSLNKSVLVLVNFSKSKSLDDQRNCLLAEHAIAILANNGVKVFHNDFQQNKLLNPNSISAIQCLEKCSLNTISKDLESKLKISKYKCELDNNNLSIDLKKFIKDENLTTTYGNAVSNIVLSNNKISKSMENACYIKHLIQDHIQYAPDTIIHIGNQRQHQCIFQSGALLNMLEGCSFSQVYIISQSVKFKTNIKLDTSDKDTKFCNMENSLNQDNCETEESDKHKSNDSKCSSSVKEIESSAEQFTKAYHQAIENSTAMKYESYNPSHESWSSRIQSLTDAAVKFDFLSLGNLDCLMLSPPSEQGSTKTSGVFIQYNHARLSNLFRKFDTMVSDGTYHPLCSIDGADLTLLSHDVEWQLLNIMAAFPRIVDEVVHSLLGKSGNGRIMTKQIALLLRDLCQVLSIYYGKVRVLCAPQMERHVHARMWLMKGVHQVLQNGLLLMNIQGLDLM